MERERVENKCPQFKVVEVENELAVHAIFDTLPRAERYMREVLPVYVERGLFTNKSLTVKDFKIKEY